MDPNAMPTRSYDTEFYKIPISKGPPNLFDPDSPSAIVMRAITLALGGTLALSAGLAIACPDGDHTHEIVRRADPSVPLTPPSRPLVWGDVNIIHTTDSHGWLLGHQKTSSPEPNYRCVSGLLLERASTVY